MPAYKSYCWALGTTSFRTVEFNRKIEQQLRLLKDFWNLPQYTNENWSSNSPVQIAYYNYIKEQGFIEDRDAPRKDKDAREKTSGLVALGLVSAERRLTVAGEALLRLADSGDFNRDNLLRIPADSFIYFKQMLKYASIFDEEQTVRPYLILAYIISELGEISKEEFTYLLPLATSRENTDLIINYIREIRNGNATVDDAIISVLYSMNNYQEAKEMFTSARIVNTALIQEIGMNRKSRSYDDAYFRLYCALELFHREPTDENAIYLHSNVKLISGKSKTYWKQYLFNTPLTSVIERDGAITVNQVALFKTNNVIEFREEFFRLLHLFKAKSLLSDYYDLNKRYFKTTDTVLFQDEIVKFDIIPNCFFALVKDNLLELAFSSDTNLGADCDLPTISRVFDISQQQIFDKAQELYGVHVRTLYDIQDLVEQERYNRLNQMIDTRFTDEILAQLMDKFERRNDAEIQAIVTNNADIPTIFEYILAIAWYKISGRQGKVLDYMNLSLDADLLPITHAAGGHEDITYQYEATADYPAHTLLIEATLANNTNQRRMEMEPVSRHLGDYLLSHPNEEAYCLFATTFLHLNVIADFRGRKIMSYYSADGTRSVDGMKIIPCNTAEIKTIIERGIQYNQLYRLFESAYQSNAPANVWYQQEIIDKLNT